MTKAKARARAKARAAAKAAAPVAKDAKPGGNERAGRFDTQFNTTQKLKPGVNLKESVGMRRGSQRSR